MKFICLFFRAKTIILFELVFKLLFKKLLSVRNFSFIVIAFLSLYYNVCFEIFVFLSIIVRFIIKLTYNL